MQKDLVGMVPESTGVRRNARRRATGRSMRSLLWGVAALVVAHLTLTAAVACLAPEIRDPDQVFKLRKLQECLTQTAPGRPLILMMGSSRVAMGYRPELVEDRTGPLYYNYGLCYSGPLFNLITLHRLLDAGIRPNKILLEVWPPHLADESPDYVEKVVDINRLSWHDVQVLAPFTTKPKNLYQNWFINRLESWSTYRFTLTRLFGPEWLATNQDSTARWSGLHERGWLGQDPYRDHPSAEVYRRYLVHTRYHLAKVLNKPTMARESSSALDEFLNVCQQEGIHVDLIWLPESPEFRNSYREEGLEDAAIEIRALAHSKGMRLIDANDWVPEDGFVDGYHLTHAGAELFTRMLEREELKPLIARKRGPLDSVATFLTSRIHPGRSATSQRPGPEVFSIR